MNDLKAIADLPTLDVAAFRPLPGFTGLDESKLANVGLRLEEGPTLSTHFRRSFEVLDRSYKTIKQLSRLPGRGEAIHCVLTGAYALFDFIPAVLSLSGRQPIDVLKVATLGFSKKNVSDLVALADDGLVLDAATLCSHYFSAADSEIHAFMVEAFAARGWPVVAMRTHAKILLIRQGETCYAIESSANLRSSHNVETATVVNDPALFNFHAKWIDDLISRGTAAAKEG